MESIAIQAKPVQETIVADTLDGMTTMKNEADSLGDMTTMQP